MEDIEVGVADSNGWKKWAAQAALTAAMAALAAYAGAERRLARVEEHQVNTDRDIARVEAKLDRLIENDFRGRIDPDMRSRRR